MSAELLVTGATGFVGAHFLPLMARHGYGLGGLRRASSNHAHLDGVEIAWSLGDVTDAAAVDAAVRSLRERSESRGRAAWLVHGAAVISYRTGSGALQDAVNVEGTRHVLAAAERYGIERFLHVSSVVTVGLAPSGREAIDEEAPFDDVHSS